MPIANDDGNSPKFDVSSSGDQCEGKEAGTYCDDEMSYVCGDEENVVETANCIPGVCVEGEGCVACLDGMFKCSGPRVMECDTSGAEPTWAEIEVCDPGSNMACDIGLGTCVPMMPIGTTDPTGTYYLYSEYNTTVDGFTQTSDADSWDNKIYVSAYDGSFTLTVAVYEVEIMDSDGDMLIEPNQHPDNPDETGPVEQRLFTFIESIPVANPTGIIPNTMELYALSDRYFYGGVTLSEYDFATGMTTQAEPGPTFPTGGIAPMSFLGYDDVNQVWYSGSEGGRRVMQYDAETQAWGWAFQFPELAGSHMDGIEVVTAPDGTPYVYVSDMTSDFIGQYRLDPNLGWVQDNLFEYDEPSGAALEGFGYGALGHFWAGSLSQTFYELGGGDLTEFLDPEG